MRGFTGKLWQPWRGEKSQARESDGRLENDLEMSEQTEKAEQIKTFTNILKSRKTAITAAAVILIAGSVYLAGQQYVKANTVSYYRVYVGGKEIGTIASKAEFESVIERKQQEFRQKYPHAEMAVHTEGITLNPEQAYKAKVDSEETLGDLYSMLTGYAKSVELKVDGKGIAVVKDEAAAQAVLEQVKEKYVPQTDRQTLASKVKLTGGAKSKTSQVKSKGASVTLESAKITEEVAQGAVEADPNKVLTIDEAVQKIVQGDEAAIEYEVQEGDTISSIAARFDVKQAELFTNNPDVEERTMQIGTVLNVKALQPALTVKTVEKVTEEIVTEPQLIIRKSDNLKAGESKVVAKGSSGLKTMEYRITKENGAVVAEQWLGQDVTKKATPRILLKGTKVVGEGTGQFAWPVSGASISSSYGSRWGRTHKGVDLVSSDRDILAADEGVVSFTGTKTGYGNVIIIDHKNGYETLYGHLSKISVKEGEIIEKGSKIGVMGSTGRSTGTHLHFEIHKSGGVQNPMKYL